MVFRVPFPPTLTPLRVCRPSEDKLGFPIAGFEDIGEIVVNERRRKRSKATLERIENLLGYMWNIFKNAEPVKIGLDPFFKLRSKTFKSIKEALGDEWKSWERNYTTLMAYIVHMLQYYGLVELIQLPLYTPHYELRNMVVRKTLLGEIVFKLLSSEDSLKDSDKMLIAMYSGLLFKTPSRIILSGVLSGCKNRQHLIQFIDSVRDNDCASFLHYLRWILSLERSEFCSGYSPLNPPEGVKSYWTPLTLQLTVLGMLQLVSFDINMWEISYIEEKTFMIDKSLDAIQFSMIDRNVNIRPLLGSGYDRKIKELAKKRYNVEILYDLTKIDSVFQELDSNFATALSTCIRTLKSKYNEIQGNLRLIY